MGRMHDAPLISPENKDSAADGVAKLLTRCVQGSAAGKAEVVAGNGAACLTALVHRELGAVVGNASLCLAELARDPAVCVSLKDTDVVAVLLNHARKDKSKATENCAIALARLASGCPEHLTRLKQLKGLEVLHHRNPEGRGGTLDVNK